MWLHLQRAMERTLSAHSAASISICGPISGRPTHDAPLPSEPRVTPSLGYKHRDVVRVALSISWLFEIYLHTYVTMPMQWYNIFSLFVALPRNTYKSQTNHKYKARYPGSKQAARLHSPNPSYGLDEKSIFLYCNESCTI